MDDRRVSVVCVLATAADGTRCALATAKRLTDGLDARVVLLVPAVIPHGRAVRDSSPPAWSTGARPWLPTSACA